VELVDRKEVRLRLRRMFLSTARRVLAGPDSLPLRGRSVRSRWASWLVSVACSC
ncbi:hypothetical protein FRC10_005818, partial [Ceratobasidium sp. 414]